MVLEGEAGDGVVGLRLQVGGEDAVLGLGLSWGMRPRSRRLATSEVMKTVLPARLRPVTPSRTAGSEKTLPRSLTASPTLRTRLSVRRLKSKMSVLAPGRSRGMAGQQT